MFGVVLCSCVLKAFCLAQRGCFRCLTLEKRRYRTVSVLRVHSRKETCSTALSPECAHWHRMVGRTDGRRAGGVRGRVYTGVCIRACTRVYCHTHAFTAFYSFFYSCFTPLLLLFYAFSPVLRLFPVLRVRQLLRVRQFYVCDSFYVRLRLTRTVTPFTSAYAH